jgi:hypothetical protein
VTDFITRAIAVSGSVKRTLRARCDTCGGGVAWSPLVGKYVHTREEDWKSPAPHGVQLADQGSRCRACADGDHSRHQPRYGGICLGCSCELVTQ